MTICKIVVRWRQMIRSGKNNGGALTIVILWTLEIIFMPHYTARITSSNFAIKLLSHLRRAFILTEGPNNSIRRYFVIYSFGQFLQCFCSVCSVYHWQFGTDCMENFIYYNKLVCCIEISVPVDFKNDHSFCKVRISSCEFETHAFSYRSQVTVNYSIH